VTLPIPPSCAGRSVRPGPASRNRRRTRAPRLCSPSSCAATAAPSSRRPPDVMGQAGHGVLLLWRPRAAASASLTSCGAYQLRDRCLDAGTRQPAPWLWSRKKRRHPVIPPRSRRSGEGISIIGGRSLPPLPVPGMIYAVLPKKFPVRIRRVLKLKHAGFRAFGRAKLGCLTPG